MEGMGIEKCMGGLGLQIIQAEGSKSTVSRGDKLVLIMITVGNKEFLGLWNTLKSMTVQTRYWLTSKKYIYDPACSVKFSFSGGRSKSS